MKHKYLILILVGLAIGFAGCKKLSDSGNPRLPVSGKWQETKLRVYLDSLGTIKDDTTYLASTFSNLDYAQFNDDSTCVISTSHLYYPAMGLFNKNTEYISKITFNFTPVGSKIILNIQINVINPGGFITRDTVSDYSSNTMMIHSVFYQSIPANKTISDAYYTR